MRSFRRVAAVLAAFFLLGAAVAEAGNVGPVMIQQYGRDIDNPALFWTNIGGGAVGKLAIGAGCANVAGALVCSGTGIAIPNACVVGGNGSALSAVTLGTGLACSGNTLTATGSGGSTVPGGTTGQVQFNNGGVFGGLTAAQLTAEMAVFTSALAGDVPASGGGTANFLRADGTWATPPSSSGTVPGGAVGQVQFNNGGVFGGLTAAQLTAEMAVFTSALAGNVPASGGGTASFLRADGTWATPPSSSGGTVSSVSVATANGFSGTVATATSTPAISIGTTVTGIMKGNGTAMAAAVAGTDYVSPAGSGAGLTGLGYGQLPALAANQVLGALTATTPAGLTVPSCAGAANALTWTAGTGFGCNSIAASGGLTVGTSAVGGGTTGYLLYDNAGVLGNLAVGSLSVAVSQVSGLAASATTDTTNAANIGSGLIPAARLAASFPAAAVSQIYGGTGTAGSAAAVGIGGGLNLSGATLASLVPVTTVASSGTAQAIAFPLSASAAFDITLTANCTLTLSGGTAGQYQTVTLILRQGGSGGFTPALPAGVKWSGGAAPTPNTTAGKIDVFTLTTPDGGTTVFGSY